MLNSILLAPLFNSTEIAKQFSDEQYIAYMLQVEVALAQVEAELGIIPAEAVALIEQAAANLKVDMELLREGVEKSSIPTIELIRQLREQVDKAFASYVHWGATSQDIMDTALVLQLQACIAYIESVLQQVISNFAQMADTHRHTLMAGRTHSQHALPITFGLKVAGWIAPLLRHRQRLRELKLRLLVLQFGGAVGTLASLGQHGISVQEKLAQAIGLGVPDSAWHTQRDNLAEFAAWLSFVTGSLAKMAQDIILMAQSEVAEVRESDDPTRGSSSTMPQKSNPIISEIIIAAARTNATLLSSVHQAMIQEHERATHGWQMEWLCLPQMVTLTGAALEKALFLSSNLVVDVQQMQRNVQASNGLMLAEALDLALAPLIGRTEAKRTIKQCVAASIEQKRHLVDVVREHVQVDLDWDALKDETHYLGVTQIFIDRIIKQAAVQQN
jgi:3-carboxy-cis,cis-muconate cycloisomerase